MGKIAIFFANGYEEIEGLTVVDICRRCNIEIDMVSVAETVSEYSPRLLHVTLDSVQVSPSITAWIFTVAEELPPSFM